MKKELIKKLEEELDRSKRLNNYYREVKDVLLDNMIQLDEKVEKLLKDKESGELSDNKESAELFLWDLTEDWSSVEPEKEVKSEEEEKLNICDLCREMFYSKRPEYMEKINGSPPGEILEENNGE